MRWIKKIIFSLIFKNILFGACLGLLVGGVLILFGDITYYPIIPWIQTNLAGWFKLEHWYCIWACAGIIAKSLPW